MYYQGCRLYNITWLQEKDPDSLPGHSACQPQGENTGAISCNQHCPWPTCRPYLTPWLVEAFLKIESRAALQSVPPPKPLERGHSMLQLWSKSQKLSLVRDIRARKDLDEETMGLLSARPESSSWRQSRGSVLIKVFTVFMAAPLPSTNQKHKELRLKMYYIQTMTCL